MSKGDERLAFVFGAIVLGGLGLVTLVGWLGLVGYTMFGHMVVMATGTGSLDGGWLLLLAVGLVLPLGLLAGGVWCALPRPGRE